jgi:hypothetical protein
MNNNIEKLKEYLNKQLDETYDGILWCKENSTPSNDELLSVLQFRKAWLKTQLDNIYFQQA